MFEMFFVLGLFTLLLWAACHVFHFALSALVWLVFRLPLAIITLELGFALCLTLLFIPLGLKCFQAAEKLLF